VLGWSPRSGNSYDPSVLESKDVTEIFTRDDVKFEIFKKLVKAGSSVRAIVTKQTKNKPRSFFDNIDNWAKEQGSSGLAYFTIEKNKDIQGKGPIGKFFNTDSINRIMKITSAEVGDTVFLSCGKISEVEKILSLAREKIANDLNLIEKNKFAFCWIVDYPMFEKDEESNQIKFSHNPFSMPQGDLNNINFTKPLD
jgi:Aspartyl-tRNA synthetase